MLETNLISQSLAIILSGMLVVASSQAHANQPAGIGGMVAPPPPGPYISSRPILDVREQQRQLPAPVFSSPPVSAMPRRPWQMQGYTPGTGMGAVDSNAPAEAERYSQPDERGGMWRW